MENVKIFLDANILFSAALGGESFVLLWELAKQRKIVLVTSRHCLAEAQINLERKRAKSAHRLTTLLKQVTLVEEAYDRFVWARAFVPEKDVPVLSSAVGCSADVLLTGDIADFGSLMKKSNFPILVRTVRAFLLKGSTG